MYIPFMVSLPLLKGEILVLAALIPYTWTHQSVLQNDLRNAQDIKDLDLLLVGMKRMGLVLERPARLFSEFMASERGEQLRHQIIQRYRGVTIHQVPSAETHHDP